MTPAAIVSGEAEHARASVRPRGENDMTASLKRDITLHISLHSTLTASQTSNVLSSASRDTGLRMMFFTTRDCLDPRLGVSPD
jgi:hypothetical protein